MAISIKDIIRNYYPITKGIFGILRPSDISSLCVALDIRLDHEEKKIFMDPMREVFNSSYTNDKLLLIGDTVKNLVNRKECNKRIHLHHISEYPLQYNIKNIIKSNIRNRVMFLDQGHGRIHAPDWIALSFTLDDKSSSIQYVRNIIQVSETAERMMNNWISGHYSIPCIVYTSDDWYFDFIDVEFSDIIHSNQTVLPANTSRVVVHLLYVTITLKTDPNIFQHKQIIDQYMINENTGERVI